MSKILSLTLARSITSALEIPTSLSASSESLPDLSPIINKLQSLTPSPGLDQAFHLLKEQDISAKILIITNGAKATTEGYVKQAGLERFVDGVQSCDEVGFGKPFGQVYDAATRICDELGRGRERWFVAAHMWDVCAARKAG